MSHSNKNQVCAAVTEGANRCTSLHIRAHRREPEILLRTVYLCSALVVMHHRAQPNTNSSKYTWHIRALRRSLCSQGTTRRYRPGALGCAWVPSMGWSREIVVLPADSERWLSNCRRRWEICTASEIIKKRA